jgi:hypothetical protein
MAKITRTQLFPSTLDITDQATKEWAQRITFLLDDVFRKIADIPFNQSEKLSKSDTGNANVEFSITHHLDRTPIGFILTNSDKACSVYDSGTAWTTSLIYLKCNAANAAVELYVF